jgi:hypothetical protein
MFSACIISSILINFSKQRNEKNSVIKKAYIDYTEKESGDIDSEAKRIKDSIIK